VSERVTPANITAVAADEVFVFGSNQGGRHGRGAAKQALTWGAKYGQASGLQGRTYGIPTKDATVTKVLPVTKIAEYVERFTAFAIAHPELRFMVTEIGCGLAGYKPNNIAPLFAQAAKLDNVYLPQRFWRHLK
jgi:hypothetical protein